MNAATTACNFQIWHPCSTKLLFFVAWLAEYGMRVRIDKPRRDKPALTVEFPCTLKRAAQFIISGDHCNAFTTDGNANIVAHRRIAHLVATPRARCALAGNALRGVHQQ